VPDVPREPITRAGGCRGANKSPLLLRCMKEPRPVPGLFSLWADKPGTQFCLEPCAVSVLSRQAGFGAGPNPRLPRGWGLPLQQPRPGVIAKQIGVAHVGLQHVNRRVP
jgi:hypothetical protein